MSAAAAVVQKDLRLLWRHRTGWLSAATFAMTSVLTYSFAFDLTTDDVRPLLPGVLWVTFLFAGIIACSRAFADEVEHGTFDAMLLAPVSRTALYLGKVTANFVALLAIEVAVMLMATILFNTALLTPELVLIVLGRDGWLCQPHDVARDPRARACGHARCCCRYWRSHCSCRC